MLEEALDRRKVDTIFPIKEQIGTDKVPIGRHVEANVAVDENVLAQSEK